MSTTTESNSCSMHQTVVGVLQSDNNLPSKWFDITTITTGTNALLQQIHINHKKCKTTKHHQSAKHWHAKLIIHSEMQLSMVQ